MRGERLHKVGAFKRALRLPAIEQSGALKHPVGTRWAHRHGVAIKPHEGEPAIALQRELMVEVNDGILFPLLEPVITGNEDKTGFYGGLGDKRLRQEILGKL